MASLTPSCLFFDRSDARRCAKKNASRRLVRIPQGCHIHLRAAEKRTSCRPVEWRGAIESWLGCSSGEGCACTWCGPGASSFSRHCRTSTSDRAQIFAGSALLARLCGAAFKAAPRTGRFRTRSVVEDDVKEGIVDFERVVVLDEAKFPEFVHEEAHARPRGPDHLRQHLLTDLGKDGFGLAVLAEVG
jgi:hypothetical protein